MVATSTEGGSCLRKYAGIGFRLRSSMAAIAGLCRRTLSTYGIIAAQPRRSASSISCGAGGTAYYDLHAAGFTPSAGFFFCRISRTRTGHAMVTVRYVLLLL